MTDLRMTRAFISALILWVVMVLNLSPATTALSGLLIGAILVAYPWLDDRCTRTFARRHELQRRCGEILTCARDSDGALTRGALVVHLLEQRQQTSLGELDEALAELELRGLCTRDADAWTGAEMLRFPGVSFTPHKPSTEVCVNHRQSVDRLGPSVGVE